MITNRICHAHVFRTGGYLLRGVLRRIEGLTIYDESLHLPVDEIANRCQNTGIPIAPTVAFIRNPWEWYVSQWAWVYNAKPGHMMSFRSYMETIREVNPDENIDTLTHHWYQRIQAHKADRIGRFENLKHDLQTILCDLMPDLVTWEKLEQIIESEPVYHPSTINGAHIQCYSRYYTGQTRVWVEHWDASLIEQFQYRFEDT